MNTELIVEIGQAHDGSLGILHSYIDSIAKTGADTIKFQMHIADSESSEYEPFRVNFSYEDKKRIDYWRRMSFDFDQWVGIKEHCEKVGVGFLCSPFSIKAIEWLEKLEVTRYKVASGEVTNLLMLDILARVGKPTMVSSGMSSFSELDKAVNIFKSAEIEYSLFQCTTSYPSKPENLGLNVITQMQSRYNCDVGLSDHSGSIYPSIAAAVLGASMVEIHGVFDKEMFGPDSSSSLTMSEIKELRSALDLIDVATVNPIDKDNVEKYSELKVMFGKSLSAKLNLKAGRVITMEDLETKKPYGKGIPVNEYKNVIGKKLKRDIEQNSFLNYEDIE